MPATNEADSKKCVTWQKRLSFEVPMKMSVVDITISRGLFIV